MILEPEEGSQDEYNAFNGPDHKWNIKLESEPDWREYHARFELIACLAETPSSLYSVAHNYAARNASATLHSANLGTPRLSKKGDT